jgi:flagellar protein FlaG
MSNKVAPFAATPDPTFGRNTPSPEHQSPPVPAKSVPTTDPVDLRLIIEEDKASGTYIYKTVNRVTGEVILQLPREAILRMHEDDGYVAGGVVRAKV